MLNLTSYRCATVPGRIGMPGHSLTLIVKGTFRLVPGGVATVDEEQLQPTGDESYPDDEERLGAPRYPSDFAWFKPKADVMLVGSCHAPGGIPAPACHTTFSVGSTSRTLLVTGNRTWQRHLLRWTASGPEPFVRMPLRYENSYGGEGDADNPIGKGVRPNDGETGETVWALPNIEAPSDPVVSRRDRPRPAGFGPIAAGWRPRVDKLGTYDRSYVKKRWPGFPEDFDWTFFNAAPEGLQVEGYLRGDESLRLENLHPVHAEYRCALPGIRVRCFVNRLPAKGGESRFEEVAMHLDTFWVDVDAERLVLVWRGWTEVVSEDAEDVADVFVMDEPLGGAAVPIEECHRRFVIAQVEETVEEHESPEEGEPGADGNAEEPAASTRLPKAPSDAAALTAQVDALLAKAGIDPDGIPPQVRERQARLIADFSDPDGPSAARQRDDLERQIAGAAATLGVDLETLPPASEKARDDHRRLLDALGVDAAAMPADPLFTRAMNLFAAALPAAGLGADDLDRIIEQAKEQRERILGPRETALNDPPTRTPLTRELVVERAARRESFEGEDLRGLDLSGLDLKGLDFSRALLAGAKLTGADLEDAILSEARASGIEAREANFSRATLSGSDLSGALLERACLREADLTSCNLEGARLGEAELTEAVLDHARLCGAALDAGLATGAGFVDADLTGATLKEATCEGADFSGARLERADFSGACLRAAAVGEAAGAGINCTRADMSGLRAAGATFPGGRFSRCTGDGSIWEGADLSGADFRWAHLHHAIFMSANLAGADLGAADMKHARFNKADLSGARLADSNLFQGSLERATLVRTDFSGANLFGAEVLDARLEDTVFTGANVRRTKVER